MTTRALFTYTALILFILAPAAAARAQERDAPKVEIGVQYTSLSFNLPTFGDTQNAPGVGARVTYNLNDYFAVEAEGNVYPTSVRNDYVTGGAAQQAQFGVKVGKRWRSVGVFAKARPGFVSFGETLTPLPVESGGVPFVQFGRERKTHFSADVGGVLEFYTSRRVLVRVDAGDTIIRYGEHRELTPVFDSLTGQIGTVEARTRHNFQFTAGVGFRFGGGSEAGGALPSSSTSAAARERRFEAGVQFSSLALRTPRSNVGLPFSGTPGDEGSQAEAGFGGRLGYNVSDALAFEAEGNFYPRRSFAFDGATGGYPSQMQFGAKLGRRFQRFGFFAKARPGFVSFSNVAFISATETFVFNGTQYALPIGFDRARRTYFSMDLGGVVEFYHTRRWLTRFDLGDTMIRYGERESTEILPVGASRALPAALRHSLQFTAGLGLRF
ncbi:MAG TPA: outer membrane beta-barrel protein [Pyrinomonadaceae bacterium]|nr:outer membrane beta-barrel protein [Pyrinomonadaceae bacterium]